MGGVGVEGRGMCVFFETSCSNVEKHELSLSVRVVDDNYNLSRFFGDGVGPHGKPQKTFPPFTRQNTHCRKTFEPAYREFQRG